jgi:NADH-quinone oxidoreductase subunit H
MSMFFSYLIFPGFFFAATLGLIAGWIDRKVTARIQYRVGPPWYQNFVDIVKLLGKETIVPQNGSRMVFLIAPVLGLMAAVLVATILGNSLRYYPQGFSGDLIVLLYLLIMPSVALMVGASSSGNPFASLGVSREMKLILGYELPFILAIVTVIIKSAGVISLHSIAKFQLYFGSHLFSFSGILAFAVAIICMQAKLCFVPFDMSDAEQELMGGILVEYSGLPLAIIKLTRAVMLYSLPLFLIVLFWARDLSLLALAGKYTALLVVMILIKNTNPRLRIDQALRFFWGPLTLLAVLAMVLAIIGA